MTAERIANQAARIKELESSLQASESRYRALTDNLLAPVQNQRLKTLAASYGPYKDTREPVVLVLLSLLQAGVDIADPLSGAPMSDTARVGHPELTATESAVMRHAGDRATVRWMGAEMERMVERFEYRLYGTQEKREPRPQCWKRPCRGARGSVGDVFCAKCGKAYAEGEEAVA
jgi:hypothetical protein